MIGMVCMLSSLVNTFYTSFVKARPIEIELGKRARGDWMNIVGSVIPDGCTTTVTVTGSNIRDMNSFGFGLKKGMTYYVWKKDGSLNFFPTGGTGKNTENLLKSIPLSSILFYEKTGERYHETRISGGGGNRVSVTGAVVGKAVGGTAGAVLLGNKGARPVQSRDVVHDDRATCMRFSNQMFINFALHDYNVLRMVIPEKDAEVVAGGKEKASQSPSEQSVPISAADEIAKFKKLLDEGVITEAEFEAKKKKLLDL
ncbi:MAG: SHOCT domain-containing protein [Clostridia bacterium]|nr:SHOCT domain-containing protein [Clostridia bacterium]